MPELHLCLIVTQVAAYQGRCCGKGDLDKAEVIGGRAERRCAVPHRDAGLLKIIQ